jgi:2-polyprenyl-3-methyl-5-hydroxy-6-metoxy-1,4-benzoquinol methylase
LETLNLRMDMKRQDGGANLYEAMPKEWVSCDVCGGSRFEVIANIDRYRMGVQTSQCQTCGLAMTNPMPTEEALHSFYETRYRVYYRRHDKPSPRLLEQLGIGERARHSAEFLAAQGVLRDGTHILDLGCADGSLLRAICDLAPGVRCFGVEPNPAYAQYARDNTRAHVSSSLDDLPPGARFNLVIVNHVLEHVRGPSAMLARLRTLLEPDASIYIDVPDAARYVSLGDLHIAHLYHFTIASLQRVAARAGLRARIIASHEPPHHPLSVRGLFVADESVKPDIGPDPQGSAVRTAFARITRRAPIFFARQSWLGRIVIGVPQRIWRAVVS